MRSRDSHAAPRILLARVTGAHGIHGELVVRSFASPPENVAAYGPLSDVDGRQQYTLKVVRLSPKGAVIARIAGISDRTAAAALRGLELYVDRARLPALDPDEFYHCDLIGLTAISPDGSIVGRVVGVSNYGAGDLLELQVGGLSTTELLPFTSAFVPSVELAQGRIVVVLPQTSGRDDASDRA